MEGKIKAHLFELQDLNYKKFHQKLIPTVNPKTVIGVRAPVLKKFAKELLNSCEADAFLSDLPHKYYDENTLHSFIINEIKDFDKALSATDAFLPFINNWATCDSLKPKVFKNNKKALYAKINDWLKSDKPYTVRFGIEMLMTHFLDKDFDNSHLQMLINVDNTDYYVNMMLAWYFATALAKQWDSTIPFIEQHKLNTFVHNKTIQKAVESYRITNAQKAYLKTLK